eukprot:g2673.t1
MSDCTHKLNTPCKAAQDTAKETCSLCLSSLDGYKITTMCGHAFHLSCFMQARQHECNKCPLCRADLAPTGATPKKPTPSTIEPAAAAYPSLARALERAAPTAAAGQAPPLRPAPMVIGSLGAVTFARDDQFQPSRSAISMLDRSRRAVTSRAAQIRAAAARRAAEQQAAATTQTMHTAAGSDMREPTTSNGTDDLSENIADEEHEAELQFMQAAQLEREAFACAN